ncbi:MAG: hypothetical protein EZS28_009704 [Streblomastix strix]|uniref:Uncharacterized protein n=1 Tax=Streblomastix strix TaxID=222440 RepID=A0A5J4WIF9_9EUKA|nr:MAG: hypothetical protein EZS28_009704 [Streblomastix strix]
MVQEFALSQVFDKIARNGKVEELSSEEISKSDRQQLDLTNLHEESELLRHNSLEELELFQEIRENPPNDNDEEKPIKTRNITGKVINIADYPYLAFVDIETDRKLSEEERNFIKNELLVKIYQSDLKVVLVKTGHGGLQIFYNIDPLIQFAVNSMVKKITIEKYDVDIFA